jgi:WD40 repeat protein
MDVNAAMADYELLTGSGEAAAVREALLLSRSVFAADLSQLASHLYGRLGSSRSPRIAGLLEEAGARRPGPWLRPLSSTFQSPRGPLLYSFQAHEGEARAIVRLDEDRFATAGTDGDVRVWDFASGELVAAVSVTDVPVRHLAAVSPNRLLAASDDGAVRLLDVKAQQVLRTFTVHRSSITALRLRDNEFFSGSEDGTLLRWSLESDQPLGAFAGHGSKINDIGCLDAHTLISAGKDRTLQVWEIATGRHRKTLTLPKFAAEALEVTGPDEVVLGTFAGELQVWSPLSPETRPLRWFRYSTVGMDGFCVLEKDLGVSTSGISACGCGIPSTAPWAPRSTSRAAE